MTSPAAGLATPLVAVMMAGLATATLPAQGPAVSKPGASPSAPSPTGTSAQRKPKHEPWRVRRAVEATSEYDNNVFLLADSRKPDLGSPSTGSTISGRYAGMQSAGDVVTTIDGAVSLRGPGIAGRRLEIRPELGVAFYVQNGERRNVALGLSLGQELPHGSLVRLAAATTPSYFARNYLADAVDANGDGSIASSERRYRHGTYRESKVALDYRVRLDRSTKRSPFGAELQVGSGYHWRTYSAPFSARDVSGPTADAGILTHITRAFGVDFRYELAVLSATPAAQVMVLDEQDVGRDVNANGRTADANVRVVGAMDRSRTEQTAGVRASVELDKRTDLHLEFEHRWRKFSSQEPLDVANNGRSDARNGGGAEVTWALRPGVRLSLRGELASQRLRRGGNTAAGEIDDYTRRRFALGVRYDF